MTTTLPEMRTSVPGPRSRKLATRLARVECSEVTQQGPSLIFWESGEGCNVCDVDGNRYVDLVAGFGVMALGYGDAELTAELSQQAATLPHAMGDVYPARVKLELLEALDRVLPGDLGGAILSSSGSDAIESALKTALLVTQRPGVVAFEGAYHGLGFGALSVTHRDFFRSPFRSRLAEHTHFVTYGDADAVRARVRREPIGAILVEPIQGRGGLRVPAAGFLRELRSIADDSGALLIADEVYTGWGRTGEWLACEDEDVIPDVVALGKALGGGLPLSACVGRPEVMRAWPASRGEALHTSTHLGHPLGCAVALRIIARIEKDDLRTRARRLGARALGGLRSELATCPAVLDVRGRGLMLGVELERRDHAARVVRALLEEGWLVLADGPEARVLCLTPPLIIPEAILDEAVRRVAACVRAMEATDNPDPC